MKVIRGLYATEGLVGIYRGAVPRTLYLVPTFLTLSAIQKPPRIE